jgi:hypothetical protein
MGDSRFLVSSTWQFSGSSVGAITAISISGGIMTVTQANNQVDGNVGVWGGFVAPYTSLNGQLFTVLPGPTSSQWQTTISAAPAMTSNTTPSGIASASSFHTGLPPWYAFNPSQEGWITDSTNTGWLQYEFPVAKTLSSYTITPWSADTFPARSPTAWQFQGSNNGSTWATLDSHSSYSSWVINTPTTFTVSSPGSYLYYRLNITANGGDTYVGIHALTFPTVPDGSPDATTVSVIGRHLIPTELAYSPLFQTSRVPVVNLARPGYTLASAVSDYASVYHPLTTAVTGHPTVFILQFDQDMASCGSATDYEANVTTILNDFWNDHSQVVFTTPIPYGSDAYCQADVQTAIARKWLLSQVAYINANQSSLLVDVASLLQNAGDPYYFLGGMDGHHPTDNATALASSLVENSIATNTNSIGAAPQIAVGGTGTAYIDSTNGNELQVGIANYGGEDYGYLGVINSGSYGGTGPALWVTPVGGTFEVVIPGGGYGAQTAGCYGFELSYQYRWGLPADHCMSLDNSNNAFSFDGGTPNDHQGNIEAKNATFSGAVSWPTVSNHVSVPTDPNSGGIAGNWAGDSGYFYWYDGAQWQRKAHDAWTSSFTLVNNIPVVGTGGGSSAAVYPSNGAGNLLYAGIKMNSAFGSSGLSCSLADTAGNVWIALGTPIYDSYGQGLTQPYYVLSSIVSAGSNTVTATCTSSGTVYWTYIFLEEYLPKTPTSVTLLGTGQGSAQGTIATTAFTSAADSLLTQYTLCATGLLDTYALNGGTSARYDSGHLSGDIRIIYSDGYASSTSSTLSITTNDGRTDCNTFGAAFQTTP